MKTFRSVVVSFCAPIVAASLALGCGDADKANPDTKSSAVASATSTQKAATPAKSVAPATETQATPASSGSAVAATTGSAAPLKDTTPPSAVGSPAAMTDVGKYLPKDCAKGRIYVNATKLLGGDVAKALEGLQSKMLGGMFSMGDAAKSSKADDAMKSAGFSPSSLQSVAVCVGGGKSFSMALSFDTSTLKIPLADGMSKAFETMGGKPAERSEEDGITFMKIKSADIAFKDSVVLIGGTKDELKAQIKGASGASGFNEAAGNVVWGKGLVEGKDASGTMKESGSDYAINVRMSPPKDYADDWKKDPAACIQKMEGDLAKIRGGLEKSSFKAALPILANAKLAQDGEFLILTTTFPKSTLADTITHMELKDLMRMGG